MGLSVSNAVSNALAGPILPRELRRSADDDSVGSVDLRELQGELDLVAEEALMARDEGIPLSDAVHDERFAALRAFHQDLRDALLVEIPSELQPWVQSLHDPDGDQPLAQFGSTLTRLALEETDASDAPQPSELQSALAELMVFEAIRLRLLVSVWQNEDFERLGGEERDIDAIAWEEVCVMLDEPGLTAPDVRPLQLIYATASVSLARDAAERADDLRRVGPDVREELSMRARLRGALRELRLTESVLLENALSNLLGEDRQELRDLQDERPLALEGLSRQAMDQRVSRGRRALARPAASWPKRRRPALFDLLRDPAAAQ